jgi:hypothetical protein
VEFFVVDYDVRHHPSVEDLDARANRAVDAAGNRSGIDPLEFDFDC